MMAAAGWDGVSLYAGSQGAPVHTVGVLVLEGPGISHRALQDIVAAQLPQMAHFRARLVAKPLGMGEPVWADINNYDPTPHLHSTALPGSTDNTELTAMIAALATTTLDPSAPLWQAWSIKGLPGGRWALAIMMSPAITGGSVAGVTWVCKWLTNALQDRYPTTVMTPEPSLSVQPSTIELIADTALELLENSVHTAWLLAAMVPTTITRLRRQLPSTGPPPPNGKPRWHKESHIPAMFATKLSPRREIALASIRLAQLSSVARAFGASTHTVALAACSLGLRTWLRRHESLTNYPLIMHVNQPLASSRIFTEHDGSRRIGLPVHIDDPVQTLLWLHEFTQDPTKAFLDTAHTGNDFSRLIALLPPSMKHLGQTVLTKLPWHPPVTAPHLGTITYIPELSAATLAAGQAKVVNVHTVAPLTHGSRLAITLSPYQDLMNLCLCVCPDQAPRVQDIATAITESADILLAAAQQHPRGQGPSVITRLAPRR